MGSTKEEQERVRSLLLDTVTLLCKNGLNFKKQLKVQGLLGITLDEDDVFIVHINEKVGELVVTQQKKDKHYEEDSDESSVDSPPAKVNRKRRSDSSPMYRGPPDKICIKTEKEEPDEDLILIEDHADDKSQIQRTLLQHQQPPGMHSVTNFQTGYQNYGHQNNMHGAPGYMTSPGAVNNTQQHTLPHQNIPQTGQPTPEKLFVPSWYAAASNVNNSTQKRRRDTHSEDKQFVCDFPGCGRKYFNKRHMLRHQTSQHGRPKVRGNMHIKIAGFSYSRNVPQVPSMVGLDFVPQGSNLMELNIDSESNDFSNLSAGNKDTEENEHSCESENVSSTSCDFSLLTYSSGYKSIENDPTSEAVEKKTTEDDYGQVNEIKLEHFENEEVENNGDDNKLSDNVLPH